MYVSSIQLSGQHWLISPGPQCERVSTMIADIRWLVDDPEEAYNRIARQRAKEVVKKRARRKARPQRNQRTNSSQYVQTSMHAQWTSLVSILWPPVFESDAQNLFEHWVYLCVYYVIRRGYIAFLHKLYYELTLAGLPTNMPESKSPRRRDSDWSTAKSAISPLSLMKCFSRLA